MAILTTTSLPNSEETRNTNDRFLQSSSSSSSATLYGRNPNLINYLKERLL